jgi:ABC-2 type transport system permease protein
LCDRVAIVDVGHLIAEGTPRELTARLGEAQHIELTVEGDPTALMANVESLPVASKVSAAGSVVDILVGNAGAVLPAVMAAAALTGSVIRSVTEQVARLRAARTLEDRTGMEHGDAVRRIDAMAPVIAKVSVTTQTTGSADFPVSLGRFDLGASQQLLLFIFITSMTAATALIETRRLGVARRMFATPTHVSTIVAGEALGRIIVAAFQGVLIMVGAAVVFGVSWGDPLAAGLLMLFFAAVAGGAGMLLGGLSALAAP